MVHSVSKHPPEEVPSIFLTEYYTKTANFMSSFAENQVLINGAVRSDFLYELVLKFSKHNTIKLNETHFLIKV